MRATVLAMDTTQSGAPHGGRHGFFIVRGLLIALGALLGVVLLTLGYVVIGGILLVMAVLRVVMVVQLRRRRATWMARRQQFVGRMRQRPMPPSYGD